MRNGFFIYVPTLPYTRRGIGNLLQPELAELIRQRNFNQFREILVEFPAPDIAEILADLSADDKAVLRRILLQDLATDVFEYPRGRSITAGPRARQ